MDTQLGRAANTYCPRSDRFRLLELRVSRTRTKPLCGGKDEGPARRRWTSATHATRTKFSPFLNEPLHGGNVPVTRRACVGLALLSPRVTSGLAKPPLLPRHSIHVLKQTACRLAASFKKPVPERPQRLAVKPSSAQALRVQASSFLLPHARSVRVKRWSCITSAPVPGSPTPRELAVADESVRKYRIGLSSSWGAGLGGQETLPEPEHRSGVPLRLALPERTGPGWCKLRMDLCQFGRGCSASGRP